MNGSDILEISSRDPKEAHRLVAHAVGETGHKAFFEFRGRQSCINQAQAKPFPGAAADAFLHGSIKLMLAGQDFCVHEVHLVHKAALQAVDSPLLEMVGGQKTTRTIEGQDELNICYIFTENPEALFDCPKGELRGMIVKNARDRFFKLNEACITSIVNTVLVQYFRSQQTIAAIESQIESQVEKKTFQALVQSLKPQDSAPR